MKHANSEAKISVVVPVYNVETYLERCVNSLLNQTYTNLEIILVNDGSTDDSGHLCDQLSVRDSRIQIVHKKNGGLSDARNVGIERATGDYIAFIDSDDWYDPVMLEILLSLCLDHDAEIAECSYRNIYQNYIQEETTCSGLVMEFTPMQAIESNLDWKYCKPVAWNKLYRRDIIGEIRYPVGKLHEDEFTTHLFYLAAKKIVYVDASFVNYERRNAGSITASFRPKNLDACEAFREKMHLVWKTPRLRGIDRKLCNCYCYILLERVVLCEAAYPDCEELITTIRNAYKDYEALKNHGIDEHYVMELDTLFQKYYNVLKDMRDA